MSIPQTPWSESTPAGSEGLSQGDNRIREMKTQIREVVDVDHKFDSSGQDADMGKHNQVSLLEQADLGTGAEGKPILGAQTVSGKAELVYTDEDDNDVQLSSNGALGSSSTNVSTNDLNVSGDLDVDGVLTSDDITIDTNNTYIKSKDAAGTGTVDLIKADASDVPVVPDGIQTATNAAPSADKDVSNKKYVDDQLSTVSFSSIEDYGTSTSSSTSKNQSDLKVCYGQTGAITGGSTATITNLPFSSSSSYQVSLTWNNAVTGGPYDPPQLTKSSGSQFVIENENAGGNDFACHWIAIGT